MLDFIVELLAWPEKLQWIMFLCILWALYRGIARQDNPIKWWEFIASYDVNAKKYEANLTKLGQLFGIFGSTYILLKASETAYTDFLQFSALLAVWLAFVGGVAGYSAYLRAKIGQVVTTRVEEPVAAPTDKKVTEVITSNAPIVPKAAVTVPDIKIEAENVEVKQIDKKES